MLLGEAIAARLEIEALFTQEVIKFVERSATP
jgi:hypothetical protein